MNGPMTAPLAIALAIACAAAQADSFASQRVPEAQRIGPVRAKWAQEPASILGVNLGREISRLDLPVCQDSKVTSQQICMRQVKSTSENLWYVEGHPFAYAAITIRPDADGIVQSIQAHMDHQSFAGFLSVLESRYGRAHSKADAPATTVGGAVLANSTWQWSGEKTTIIAVERFVDARSSLVVFVSSEHLRRQSARRDDESKAAANKL